MSAAEQSVLPTSVLAPKTMAVRRAAILFFAPLPSVVPRGHCRVVAVQAFLGGYRCRLRQDTQAVLLRMHTLYSLGSFVYGLVLRRVSSGLGS